MCRLQRPPFLKAAFTRRGDSVHESRGIYTSHGSFFSPQIIMLCMKKVEEYSANWAESGGKFGEVSAALAHPAAVAGRMFQSEGLGWLL